jgi:N-acetylneuraminic acid mutarotase
MPQSPWKKGAPFPEPDEELYGVAVNGKLYVIGGWGEGKARGANYEYDPAADKWTKKKSMPRPAHHAALAAANGKIYVCGGFVAPEKSPLPIGAAWQPIDDVWEYDPAADSWKALAPLPGKRGATVAVEAQAQNHVSTSMRRRVRGAVTATALRAAVRNAEAVSGVGLDLWRLAQLSGCRTSFADGRLSSSARECGPRRTTQ